ncbi:hypothetical protein TP2_17375 [Thioclava pacifica DSM 10166]|uniref:Uncharacterized protein n=1 Tax=Thioclava pacifica DSM 10166 TaxID=1353537 RepID=A0A074JAQ9_9RHOB|nr:hypothetical protein TP2_17375 [Thioclava pacifica DSM 10166]
MVIPPDAVVVQEVDFAKPAPGFLGSTIQPRRIYHVLQKR